MVLDRVWWIDGKWFLTDGGRRRKWSIVSERGFIGRVGRRESRRRGREAGEASRVASSEGRDLDELVCVRVHLGPRSTQLT